MSWHNRNYKQRAALVIDNTTGGATSVNVTFTIPTDWDAFWEHVRSDGKDVRLTLADGATVVPAWNMTWTYATRSAVIVADSIAVTAGKMCVLWLYWDYDAESAAGTSAATGSTPKTAYVEQSAPGPINVVRCLPLPYGDTRAPRTISKSAAEVVHIWWDLSAVLEVRAATYNQQTTYEEISYVSSWAVYEGSTAKSTMVTANKTTVSGKVVKTLLQGGTDGTSYTMRLTVVTTLGRTLEFSASLRIQTPTEQ